MAPDEGGIPGLRDAALRMITGEKDRFAIAWQTNSFAPGRGLRRDDSGTGHASFGDDIKIRRGMNSLISDRDDKQNPTARWVARLLPRRATLAGRNYDATTCVSGMPVIAANSSRSAIRSAYDIAR